MTVSRASLSILSVTPSATTSSMLLRYKKKLSQRPYLLITLITQSAFAKSISEFVLQVYIWSHLSQWCCLYEYIKGANWSKNLLIPNVINQVLLLFGVGKMNSWLQIFIYILQSIYYKIIILNQNGKMFTPHCVPVQTKPLQCSLQYTLTIANLINVILPIMLTHHKILTEAVYLPLLAGKERIWSRKISSRNYVYYPLIIYYIYLILYTYTYS